MIPLLFGLAAAAEPADVDLSTAPDAAGVAAVRAVVRAEPFVLELPYRYDWSAAHPTVQSGTRLVLSVDPEWLAVRDARMPTLFVEGVPAEVLWRDPVTSTMGVVVPLALSGTVQVWFGPPVLPETVTAEDGARALAAARAGGATGFLVPASLAPIRLADHAALATPSSH